MSDVERVGAAGPGLRPAAGRPPALGDEADGGRKSPPLSLRGSPRRSAVLIPPRPRLPRLLTGGQGSKPWCRSACVSLENPLRRVTERQVPGKLAGLARGQPSQSVLEGFREVALAVQSHGWEDACGWI